MESKPTQLGGGDCFCGLENGKIPKAGLTIIHYLPTEPSPLLNRVNCILIFDMYFSFVLVMCMFSTAIRHYTKRIHSDSGLS